MSAEFTRLDHKLLDFLQDNYLDLMFQLEAENGKITYFRSPVKLEITFGQPDTTKITFGETQYYDN
jgi:hypothetical protein